MTTGSSEPIRVMLVDDHAMVRNGLAAFLSAFEDFELVGEAANGTEAVKLCKTTDPDVVLMDLVMPEMDGAAATRLIREQHPNVQVIALTSFNEKDLVESALDAGAIGYLLKNVAVDDLAQAIRAAHEGQSTLSPEVAHVLLQAKKLEQLANKILEVQHDLTSLATLLNDHVPEMFPWCCVAIRIFPDHVLLHHPEEWQCVPDQAWEWLSSVSDAHSFQPTTSLPWGEDLPDDQVLIAAPISNSDQKTIGGIVVNQTMDSVSCGGDPLPLVKSLAAQIATALQSFPEFVHVPRQREVTRELALAGRIQASFLPDEVPQIEGWQISALLVPAHETAGDFYDFIALPDSRWGLVVADVADKGVGAALYMALSRTLIRNFAATYPMHPEKVVSAVNSRVLTDARAGFFVSVFYCVLDPTKGTLTYCNAGHNPPLLINSDTEGEIVALKKTGMVIGVLEETLWEKRSLAFTPGGTLLLYTDGVTEAQDPQGGYFGEERLVELLMASRGSSTGDVLNGLLSTVQDFVLNDDQTDDITMVAVKRHF
jgi:serine phosphatase RsbU (regulator of sigma subunit)/DNA-binding NarL/FixJ family response regulator